MRQTPKTQMAVRRLTLLVCVALLLCLSFASADIGRCEQAVSVGIYENAPKVLIDASGAPAGLFIDILEHIADREGWSLRYVPGTWGEGLDRLAGGEIDLMPDVAYTAERETLYDFHKVPVLSSWFQVYARKGSGIKSILDLNETRVAVLERSVQQAAFEQLAKGFGLTVTLIALPDYRTIFQRVAAGEADAAITNRFYGLMHAQTFGLEDTAVIFNPTNLYFAASRGKGGALLQAIDNHLDRLKKDPQSLYYSSLKRWTSEKIHFALPSSIKVAGLAVSAFLLVTLTGSIVLKRQVNARTRELRQINREMEARIERRTAQLAAAMEKAQAADHLKSAFLATMSHELRTPLNSIIGFTGILLQGLAGPLNAEQHKQLGMVQSSSRHLLALINDVLDISKIEAGQLSLCITSFPLRPTIENVMRLVAPQAGKKGIELRQDIGNDVDTIVTDNRRLEQVLLNLLNNALKFTEHGEVRVRCRSENDHYLISVIDTGIGMRPEDLPKIFAPFHQIDSGLSRRQEGTGLGCSISQKLITMMGGTIEVQSRLGAGSTFTIRIPKRFGAPS